MVEFAQKRADFIAASDGLEFRHPADLQYGENLAWHSRETKSCPELVQMWYDEIKLYNFKAPMFDLRTGHFSQLVWRDTERVGCARAISSGSKGGIYLVCNYDPPGNFLGEESANVPEPRSSIVSTVRTSVAPGSTGAPGLPDTSAPLPPASSARPSGPSSPTAQTAPPRGSASPTTTAGSSTSRELTAGTRSTLAPADAAATTPAGRTPAGRKKERKNKKRKNKKAKKNKKGNKKKRKNTSARPSTNTSRSP